MTRFSRFIDGVELVPAESDWTPYTPSQLLAKLRVRSRPRADQRAAIEKWLAANEPAPFLRMCLEDDGYVVGQRAQNERRQSAA